MEEACDAITLNVVSKGIHLRMHAPAHPLFASQAVSVKKYSNHLISSPFGSVEFTRLYARLSFPQHNQFLLELFEILIVLSQYNAPYPMNL